MIDFRKNSTFIFKDILDEIFYDLDNIVIGEFFSIPKFFIGDAIFGRKILKAKSPKLIDISIYFEECDALCVESCLGDAYFYELPIEIYCMHPQNIENFVEFKKELMRHISYHLMSSCLSISDSKRTMGSDFYFLEDIKIDAFSFSLFVQSFYFKESVEYLCLKNLSYYFEIDSSEYNILRVEILNSIKNIYKKLSQRN